MSTDLDRATEPTVPLTVQVPAALKAEAEKVLADGGMTPDVAIRLYLAQIVRQGILPIHGWVFNEETEAALRASAAGEGLLGPYQDADEMFRELGIDLGDR